MTDPAIVNRPGVVVAVLFCSFTCHKSLEFLYLPPWIEKKSQLIKVPYAPTPLAFLQGISVKFRRNEEEWEVALPEDSQPAKPELGGEQDVVREGLKKKV